jgi:hypothetical protein
MIHHSIITRVAVAAVAVVGLAVFGSSSARAQSSGNFTAQVLTSQCTINTIGGSPMAGSLQGGKPDGTLLDTYIKTPNSQYTTLLVTPSMVAGLFNNTAITQDMPSSANSAAVKIRVTLDGNPVAPATTATPWVIYDQRFQQLSTNVFEQILTCSAMNNCSMDLIESTLGAHSLNFVAPNVGGGTHHLTVEWKFACSGNDGVETQCSQAYVANTAGACAGPGSVTIQQVKAFTQSGGVSVSP